jgi:hypothetical protein
MSKESRPRKQAGQQTKRESFEEAGRFPVRTVAIAAAAVVVIAVGAIVGVTVYHDPTEVGGPVVSEGGVSYVDTSVDMSLLTSSQVDAAGAVTLSVAELKSKKIGGFIYSRSTPMPAGYDSIEANGLPILAYVAPSGRLVVATSLCEPCRSYDFHIEGDTLVCNTCFTRWDLNTLKGVGGGCLAYPPSEVTTVVEGDVIYLQQSELEAWAPRI